MLTNLYFDCKNVYLNDFVLLIIVLYYDKEINKRALGVFILLTYKRESNYIKVFNAFNDIKILEKEIELSL